MRVIGVDPGKASGIAILNTEGMVIEHMSIVQDDCFDLAHTVWEKRGDLPNAGWRVAVVCEDFIPRWGQKFNLDSVYHIGALSAVVGRGPLKMVAPGTHKGNIPTKKVTRLMKAQGYKVGAGHSRDALSLCLYWAGFKLRDPNVLAFLAEED